VKRIPIASRSAIVASLFFAWPAYATDYYVATTGSDTNPGTIDRPFATVGRGQTAAVAGDTVFIHGGTYAFSGTGQTEGVRFTKNGAAGRYINYFAVDGEVPVFDLTNLRPNARVTGLSIECDWIHIRGLEVTGVQQFQSGQDSWGVRFQGSNNVIENLNVHHNQAPGVFITSGANNLILNCDSHHNYDVLEGGGSGDGFGCHSSGGGNVLRGCRSYSNSDDGFDFINAAGTCTAEGSWSFMNGWIPDTTTAAGNGAGFKSGGYGNPPVNVPNPIPRHVVRQNVAFGNRSQGFYANHHPGPGGIDFFNNTAFRNQTNFDMTSAGTATNTLQNNIALTPGGTIANLVGGTNTFNSWTLTVTVSTADFLSVAEAEALMPRQADGSLPAVNFLHLAPGSDLIDKGTDVGLPFTGTAPDLGAFEVGLSPVGGFDGGVVSTGAGGSVDAGAPRDAGRNRDATIGAGGAAGSDGGGSAGAGGMAGGMPGTGGSTGAGGAGAGAGGSGATGGTAGQSGGTPGAGGSIGSGGSPGTAGTAGGGTATGGTSNSGTGVAGGCSCRTTAGGDARQIWSLVSLLALAALRRRRTRITRA